MKCVHNLRLAHWQSKFLTCQAWGLFSAEQSCFFKSSDVPLEAREKKPHFCIITAFSSTKFTALWEITKQKVLGRSPHCTDMWMQEKIALLQKVHEGCLAPFFSCLAFIQVLVAVTTSELQTAAKLLLPNQYTNIQACGNLENLSADSR